MKMKNVSKEKLLGRVKEKSPNDSDSDADDDFPLRCLDCSVNFTSRSYLYNHLFHHIKQPRVELVRTSLPPLKITLKNTRGNSFEIVHSPTATAAPVKGADLEGNKLEEPEEDNASRDERIEAAFDEDTSNVYPESEGGQCHSEASDPLPDGSESDLDGFDAATLEDINGIIESETGSSSVDGNTGDSMVTGPIITEITDESVGGGTSASLKKPTPDNNNYDTIPGAEPTPPPEPSLEVYPKIRIKTTGLLKDPIESTCTITEITEDNPSGDALRDSSSGGHLWSTPSLEDPLKLPDADDNILSLFNNNDRAKDFGFTSSESEYMSLDRLDNRSNSGALQLYNPPTSVNQSPLDSLTGLPMQALAQQVSRLTPSGNGMHQQNVLINIQQFPQAPPQTSYQPPPMYHPPGQPMYQPYQYQPPNPMYYPPGPTYPPPQHMQQPPQMPPLTQIGQPMGQAGQMGQPPMSQAQIMTPSSQGGPQNQGQIGQQQQQQQQHQQQQQQAQQHQQGQYRQPAPRPVGPRQPMTGQRMPVRQPLNPRGAPMSTRVRGPMPLSRRNVMVPIRGSRMRMPNGPTNTQFRGAPVKRQPEQIKQEQNLQPKKKRFDVLTPDKDDDDCQVICMQPKNTDGLPQIESVQGGTSEPAESSIMHLSDSITLSVRNPPPKPASPKKSDAKAVANILATRGITVTPTAKPKDKVDSPIKSPGAPSSLNLNGAVSIIPSAKPQSKKGPDSDMLTVDLTDDSSPNNSPQKSNTNLGLPYRCYLCPAQYPNALGLSKHRQNYHKTSSGITDMGIPLVNMKQPGVLQKLGQLGIHNFIPLPTSQPDATFAVPIINARNPGNVHAMGATTMLLLGPVKTIPRPGVPNTGTNSPPKTPNFQK